MFSENIKHMISVKKLDICGLVILILLCSVCFALSSIEQFFISYFFLWLWQAISMFIHMYFCKNQPVHKYRTAYEWTFLICTLPLLFFGGFLILLVVLPFTNLWYLNISLRELKLWQHRRFIQLR